MSDRINVINGKGSIQGTVFDDEIYGSNKADTIHSSGGTDTVYAGAGNDTIHTSKYGSIVNAGEGNDKVYVYDTYPLYSQESGQYETTANKIVFSKGAGNDTIYGGSSTDFIEIIGYTKEDLTFTKKGNNLFIQATYQVPSKSKMITKSDSLTLVDWFIAPDRIDTISFSEGLVDTLNIGSGDNYIEVNGTAKKDTINISDNSNVEINTGKGNDIINLSGSGQKIVNIIIGQGNKTISLNDNFTGTLSLNFESDKVYELSYNKSEDGRHLVIAQNYDPDNCQHSPAKTQFITVENFFEYGFDNEGQVLFNYRDYYSWDYKQNVDFDTFVSNFFVSYFGKTNANNEIIVQDSDVPSERLVMVYGGNKNDKIDTSAVIGEGAFIVTGQKGSTNIQTGDSIDTFVVTNVSGTYTSINDQGNIQFVGGGDVIDLYGLKKGDGITVLFDVAIDDTQSVNKDIVFITSSGVGNYARKGYATTGVEVKNWFGENYSDGNGKLEYLYVMDAVAQIDEHIDFVQKRVKEWLNNPTKNKSYHQTAMDVFRYGTSAEKNFLMSVYTLQNLGLSLYDEDTLVLNGSKGNDVLYASCRMTVNGEKGNDKLVSEITREEYESFASILNDVPIDYKMNGGYGDDVLVAGYFAEMNAGKGTNVIQFNDEYARLEQGGGADYIHFNQATIGDLSFEKIGNNLYISTGTGGIDVVDYFKNPVKSSLKGVVFDNLQVDYNSKSAAEIVSLIKSNSISITELLQQAEDGLTVFDGEFDKDIKGSDIIGVKDDLYNKSASNDNIYGYRGDNHLKLFNGAGNDTIHSGKGQDYLYFVNVNPETATEAEITLADLRLSRYGNNLVIRYTDDDSITIANYYKLKGKTSILGVEVAGRVYSVDELLKQARFCENLTLKGVQTTEGMSEVLAGNDNITGNNWSDSLFGYDGNDIIYTGKGSDSIVGGKGNDTFYGQGGKKVYRFMSGDGNDTIIASKNDVTILDFSQDNDLRFGRSSVVSASDGNAILAYYKSGKDLIIKYGVNTNSDSTVTIKNFFTTKTSFYLRDSSGGDDIDLRTVQIVVNETAKKVNGTSQDDYICYYSNDEHIDYDDYKSYYANVNRTITTGAGNDTIYIGDGGYYGTGSSIIKAGEGDDNIHINAGDHKIYGESGINRIYLSSVDMEQTTTIFAGKGGTDILIFNDIAFEELEFSRNGNNLIISKYFASEYGEYGDFIERDYTNKVILSGYFKGNHSVNELQTSSGIFFLLNVEHLLGEVFADPSKKATLTGTFLRDSLHGTLFDDTIKGGANDDALYGHKGNDNLYGQAGSNTLHFSNGDGNDIVYMDKNGTDTIVFGDGISENNLTYKIDGKDLVISYGVTDSIRVKNYTSTAKDKISIDKITFASGASFNFTDRVLTSVDGIWEDVVDNAKYLSKEYHGDDKNNFVYVNSSMYVDEVYAGLGNDCIQINSTFADVYGGKGDDTYIIDSLAKSTSINDIAGDDAIVVNSNQKDVNLIFNVFRRLPEFETEDSGMIDVRPLDGSGPIEFYDLFILSDSNLNKMIKMNATGKEIPISNVSVYDYFSQRGELQQGGAPIDYKIETIETKDGSVVTYSDLDAVRNSIGLWLSTKVNEDGTYKYDCALDVLSKQDKGDMAILLAYYDSVWSDQPGVLPQ